MNEIKSKNFISNIIEHDLETNKHTVINLRFPPEPNGYLHVGHAKSICLNFGLARDFNGKCFLRFDDTNPEKETIEYIESIKDSIEWLGFKWDENVKYASDYFDQLYDFTIFFIKQGLAYVCDLDANQMREYRGSLTKPGIDSPYRTRLVDENLELFENMRLGKYPDGSKTVRLKIDMQSSNLNMRDPVIYRIKHIHHIRTQDKWCIYPMYDYTHCISDALEKITHSCCTLEFEDHRPLYDWVVNHLFQASLIDTHPRQIEFSRLELQYTVTSKRKLAQLVENKIVNSWDDPRMPTIEGMRRRGYTASGIQLFITRCGISKAPNIVDLSLLENSIREDLEKTAVRVMAVLNPLKIILTNFNESVSNREIALHPDHSEYGMRTIQLSREIYIDKDDFMLNPIAGFNRLSLNKEVRLRYSYIIKCTDIIYDNTGGIKELHCILDTNTLGKNPVDRKVKGVIHWVSSQYAKKCLVNIYDRLFTNPKPDHVLGHTFTDFINPHSLVQTHGFVEPIVTNYPNETRFQFERLGYFVSDRHLNSKENLVFNKVVGLKDTWKH